MAAAPTPALTPRESQILALVAAGLTTPQIADRLGIAVDTIKTHLSSVYRKTGTGNRVQAARFYLRSYGGGAPAAAGASPPATTAAPADATLLGQQIAAIEARLDELAEARQEAELLQRMLDALRALDRG